jgi:hypothetical protein
MLNPAAIQDFKKRLRATLLTIDIGPKRQIARAQTGLKLGEFDRETQNHRLVTPVMRSSRKMHLVMTSIVILGALLVGTESVFAESTPPRRALITESIDESKLIRLTGNTRFEARAANDQGRVDDSMVLRGIQLQLKRSQSQEAAAEQLADDVNKPGSSHFHRWLTPDQYVERFGVSLEDIASISSWLSSHGFQVQQPSPSQMTITFSGTAGQIHEAFHTEIHALNVGGKLHFANMSDPWIPEALAPAIEGIVSLHDFRPHAVVHIAKGARPTYTNVPAGVQHAAIANGFLLLGRQTKEEGPYEDDYGNWVSPRND